MRPCSRIKKVVKIPVIYFPSGADAMSGYFDAIYFMSMLNSHNLRHVIREQVAGAPIVRRLGLEPISMGYVIIAPGMKVGEVGEADIIPRNDIKSAVSYALAAEYLGMQTVYLEAGSGAPEPVPEDMIKAVKQELKIPLFIGGGIREPEAALRVKNAGADVIITGTIVENNNYSRRLESIIRAIKEK